MSPMSYLTQILQPDEKVLFDGHLHWIIYRRAILLLILAGLAAAALRFTGDQNGLKFAVLSLAFIFGALGLAVGFLTWLRSFSTEIAVTTTRVIYKTGFVRRHTVEMNMDKVESVDVDQSLAGRLLGYGSVRIRGTGASLEKLDHIADAIALRNAITSR
ncbi:PH (Pleckstrin Homology) domain-containing protein [Methylovirgula ligni]|uniref:PH (Pleckstrin Homology) domain-containing protein n=2 Tax=Methylovirgula ligni TaxID=569860 RepID=A0A3D9Z4Q2_9HYPH|nr:PH domain-containing protein [Methylovirgula ligni]REF86129.1 PH (Pleckstrin Homology) domain-containing protein [Methylovirgula ligni]